MTNKLFTWMLLGAITLGAITGCEEKPDDEPTIMVTEIVLNDTTLSLQPGSSAMLEVTSVEPANAADTTITWSSNPTGWVDATGKVTVPTAATAGQTGIITATANDGGRAKTECTITVLAGSDTDPDPEEMTSQMILTANNGEITFNMVGSGTASIDWGDGLITPPFPVAPYVLSHTYLNNYGDLNGDDYSIIISCQNITHLNCQRVGATSGSRGILTNIDISRNTALTHLDCRENWLTSLDVSKNTALTNLDCYSNQLTSLDVSGATALMSLNCNGNQLTSLDVSKNTALTNLNYSDNRNLRSLDVSKNTALTDLNCYSNQLTNLDVSKNTALTYLNCHWNQLEILDISKNTALTELSCSSNQLTSLDVSKNTALTDLDCGGNQLTSLDVSKNTVLTDLDCRENWLTSLDVSKNTALTNLNCSYNNQLTSLNVSGATALTNLNCNSNQLTSLDVSSATKLNYLYISNNQFTAAGLNALFATLHSNTIAIAGGKIIYIYGNPGAGECDRSIAEAKGWTVIDSY